MDFSGNPGVKNPHFQCRGMGSIPGQGNKIPHAATKKNNTIWLEPRELTLKKKNHTIYGNSLAVQWLRPHASTAGDAGLIPGRELRSHMPAQPKNKKRFFLIKKNLQN